MQNVYDKGAKSVWNMALGNWVEEKQGKFNFGSETFLMRICLWLIFLLVHFYPKTRRGYLRFGVSQSVTGRAALRYEETGQYNKWPGCIIKSFKVYDAQTGSHNQSDWQLRHEMHVLFTDEPRFCQRSHDGLCRVWRYNSQNKVEHDRFGKGSMMVWADVSINGRSDLHIFDGGYSGGSRKKSDRAPTINNYSLHRYMYIYIVIFFGI